MIDWSRQARKKRKLIQAADENQTQITDYFSILDRIQSLTNENKKLSAMLQNLISQETDVKELNFTPVLKYIISNAENNSSLVPKCRRHPEILTLSGRENLLKISRVDGGWVWPVQSQE